MGSYVLPVISALYIMDVGFKIEARFCSHENTYPDGPGDNTYYERGGNMKYYICSRNEYCCKVGCCVSPTFQFYQLWYYWLMVIFMLVVCSGGQWWYRYWIQGGSRGEANLGPISRPVPRPTRVAYHPARDTVTVVQHIWKPNYPPGGSRGSPPPMYSQMHLHEGPSSGIGGTKPSHLNQIYGGPPPSYDSVVAQSRGAGPPPPPPGVHHHAPSHPTQLTTQSTSDQVDQSNPPPPPDAPQPSPQPHSSSSPT